MAGELVKTQHSGFIVGELVQRITDIPALQYTAYRTEPEGILRKIYRAQANSPFSYVVEWLDGSGTKKYCTGQVKRSDFADFPPKNSFTAQMQTWLPGDNHYWVQFSSLSSAYCLYCTTPYSRNPVANAVLCSGYKI